uniref:Uncharacterized protein n=1 Tax=Anguilla anguilla TaxID=7936 RepID=A0A0E9QPF5_ANGAN
MKLNADLLSHIMTDLLYSFSLRYCMTLYFMLLLFVFFYLVVLLQVHYVCHLISMWFCIMYF